ncbi:nuclear transport factor 2 family protein [Halovivax cerinus]|uniref:Nuclear transport factor 2 family protein n=1 Tax=Halovivax cerinus TaxID=1487865 RepID=A0ABD5NMF9_9EURY|nr:nuclear transport factor 2 family protein [Halovivax cerinus]
MTDPTVTVDRVVPDGGERVEPRKTLRRYYDRVDANDVDGLLSLFAADIRYERPGQGVIEGRDELRTFYERDRPLEDGSHEIYEILVDGSSASVRGTFSGRLDGDPVSFGFADHHRFDADGLITARYTFTDRDSV